MTEANEKVRCKYCQHEIMGRSDKRFCNDYCRSSYNNRLRKPASNLVRNINHCLAKNRRILGDCIPEEKESIKINREKLMQKGFEFKYFTHAFFQGDGTKYFFCYDVGYIPLEEDLYMLVKKNEQNSI